MGIENFKIELETHNYSAGDTINGEICFDITSHDFKFSEIIVKLRGKAEVYFSK